MFLQHICEVEESVDGAAPTMTGDNWSFYNWICCELNSLEESTVNACMHYFEDKYTNSMSDTQQHHPQQAHVNKLKKSRKSLKLWEFLRNLLLNENTCPSLIKWDDISKRTFKFVEKEKVAKLWGNRKNNPNMNYEKLSRAMRYYYRSKILQPVIGKRLVYKFGPKATGL